MAGRQYTDATRNAIDNIKYMAQSIYGLLPKDCKFVTRTIEITYDSSESESNLVSLDNPMFVTHVQVAKSLSKVDNKVFISVSANDVECENYVDVGTDGDMLTGNIWKYIKVSGDAEGGDTILLTLTGFELDYSSYPQMVTLFNDTVSVTSTLENNMYLYRGQTELTEEFEIEEGQSYKVTKDGVEYEIVAGFLYYFNAISYGNFDEFEEGSFVIAINRVLGGGRELVVIGVSSNEVSNVSLKIETETESVHTA